MSLFTSLFRKPTTPEVQNPTTAPTPAPTPGIKEKPQARQQDRRHRKRIDARRGTRVLIIDDSQTIVAALHKTLVSTGYETLEALDAETGIEIARQEKPDLIFLDIVLPGMSGFAALRTMRRDPQTQHIPIIMISGNEQATEQFYANRIGADDFMKKPFSRAEVFAHIEPLLDTNQIPRRRNLAGNETPPLMPAAQPAPAAAPAVEAPAAPPASVTTRAEAPVQAPANPPASASSMTEVRAANDSPAVIAATAPPPAQPNPAPQTPIHMPALEARKELTAMGLQYFDQQQFIAAIQRGDRLAFELFVAGGGIDIATETDGKTPLQIAREHGRTQIFAMLRQRLAAERA